MTGYIKPNPEAIAAFLPRKEEGPVTMLNLLRFREEADYSSFQDLAPSEPISGKDAYKLYMKHVQPLLQEAEGEVVFMGKANPALIGPSEESWDLVLLVQYPTVQTFLQFASTPEYLAVVGHRTAALADSRLIPTIG